MQSGKKMTLWEVEQFLNRTSDVPRSLADPWELKDVSFDPEVLLWNIMRKGGQLGPLFNNIATYYKMNKYWWENWRPTFQRWWMASDKDYEPLWDRDGYEVIHEDTTDRGYNKNKFHGQEVMDDDTSKKANTKEVTDDKIEKEWSETTNTESDTDHTWTHQTVMTPTGKKLNTVSGGTDNTTSWGTTVTQNDVSAYDSSTLVTHDKQTVKEGGESPSAQSANHVNRDYGSTSTESYAENYKITTDDKSTKDNVSFEEEVNRTGSETTQEDKTVTTTYGETGTDDRTTTNDTTSDTSLGNDKDFDRTYHSFGNWGISITAQKLLESEFKVRFQTNPYELMADLFLKEMTDGVWV